METQEQAIKRLLPEHGTLYCVTNYLQNDVAGTCIWNIYANLEDAMRWIQLSEEYAKTNYFGYREISREQVGAMIKELVFEHSYAGSIGMIRSKFVLDIYNN